MAKVTLTKAQKAKRRRQRSRQIKGALFLLLAVIGIYHIAASAFGYVRTALSDEGDKEEYAALIAPLVSLDPVPFESIDKASPTMLMQSAIWAVVTGEDVSKYSRTETGQLMVPVVDVERYFTRMYGSTLQRDYDTFEDFDLTFEYLPEKEAYVIPITSQVGSFVPQVTGITKAGGTKILTVAYVQYESSSNILDPTSSQTGSSIVKYMEYVLLKDGSDYHIYSVRYPSEDSSKA